MHTNIPAKTLQRTDSIQIKYSDENLVSDFVLRIKKEIQPNLQSPSSPPSIWSINSEFPNKSFCAPAPSMLHYPSSQFSDENSFTPQMQMNAVTIKSTITNLQTQVSQIQKTMNQMYQTICQWTQWQSIFITMSICSLNQNISA